MVLRSCVICGLTEFESLVLEMLEVQKENISAQSKISSFKVVLVGNMNVGKTSLVLQFAQGQFNPAEKSTVGAAYVKQTVCVDNTITRLDIWDTAGQERYQSLVRLFYRGAQAAVVVYDITEEETFEGAKRWIKELRNELGPDTVIVLAGNKQDMDNMRMVERKEAQAYADENKLIFLETSAKTAVNVTEIFVTIAKTLSSRKEHSEGPGHGITLIRYPLEDEKSAYCCN